MKKLIILLLCAPLWAQNTKTGSITGTSCFGIDTTNAGTVGISVQNSSSGGAWSGTIQPSASIGGDPAANITVTPSTGGAAVSTITASGVYYAAISGSTYVQVCGNTVTNTAAIKMFPAQYSKNFGGSGGGGTINANSGNAGAITFYPAAGGSTTVGPDTLLTDNGTTLTYTGTGGINAFAGPLASGGAATGGTTLGKISASAAVNSGTLFLGSDGAVSINRNGNNHVAIIASSIVDIQGASGTTNTGSFSPSGNIIFTGGKGQHFQTQAANNDAAGVCSGTTTTCAVSFTTSYTSTPSCVATPTTAGVTSFIITTQANTGFTITYAPTGTTNFNYICIGDPN